MTQQIHMINQLSEFRKLVILAIFSDDELSKLFSLKGGSALDLIHKITYRSSMDVDVAMQDDIASEDMIVIEKKLETALQNTFNEYDPPYSIFQFKFEKRPFKENVKAKKFWGGYRVEFKIRKGIHPIHDLPNPQKAAREAEIINPVSQSKKFIIDISKYEFTEPSEFKYLEGYSIKVYTLEMIVYEKLRAICQKLPEYEYAQEPIKARPKDFYDIYILQKLYGEQLSKDVLWDALVATAKKRETLEQIETEDIDEVFDEIQSSSVMENLWKAYQRNYSYSADIPWHTIMKSIRTLYEIISENIHGV